MTNSTIDKKYNNRTINKRYMTVQLVILLIMAVVAGLMVMIGFTSL